MHRICTWSRTNGVSFCSKDCFYAFYKLGNAPKSVSAGASPRTPLGKLTALPQTLAGEEGACRVRRKNPTPSSALRASVIQAMLCRPPTPPKIILVTALTRPTPAPPPPPAATAAASGLGRADATSGKLTRFAVVVMRTVCRLLR